MQPTQVGFGAGGHISASVRTSPDENSLSRSRNSISVFRSFAAPLNPTTFRATSSTESSDSLHMELDDNTAGTTLTHPTRIRWVDALTTAGWCLWLAYLALVAIELRRAFAITTSRFEDGVWGQRVETISFVSIPQNSIVLLIGALCVALAASCG